jgi:hypothetical protein
METNMIFIKTDDPDLRQDLENLKIEGTEIVEPVRQAYGLSNDMIVYINLGIGLINIVTAILNFIKAKQNENPHKTKAIILQREKNVNLEQVIIQYEDSINIEIRHEE